MHQQRIWIQSTPIALHASHMFLCVFPLFYCAFLSLLFTWEEYWVRTMKCLPLSMFANNERVVNKVLTTEHQLLNAWRVASLAGNTYSFFSLLSFMSVLNRFCAVDYTQSLWIRIWVGCFALSDHAPVVLTLGVNLDYPTFKRRQLNTLVPNFWDFLLAYKKS